MLDFLDAHGILDCLSLLRVSIVPPEHWESIVLNEIARSYTVVFGVHIFTLGRRFWRFSRSANCALKKTRMVLSSEMNLSGFSFVL